MYADRNVKLLQSSLNKVQKGQMQKSHGKRAKLLKISPNFSETYCPWFSNVVYFLTIFKCLIVDSSSACGQ